MARKKKEEVSVESQVKTEQPAAEPFESYATAVREIQNTEKAADPAAMERVTKLHENGLEGRSAKGEITKLYYNVLDNGDVHVKCYDNTQAETIKTDRLVNILYDKDGNLKGAAVVNSVSEKNSPEDAKYHASPEKSGVCNGPEVVNSGLHVDMSKVLGVDAKDIPALDMTDERLFPKPSPKSPAKSASAEANKQTEKSSVVHTKALQEYCDAHKDDNSSEYAAFKEKVVTAQNLAKDLSEAGLKSSKGKDSASIVYTIESMRDENGSPVINPNGDIIIRASKTDVYSQKQDAYYDNAATLRFDENGKFKDVEVSATKKTLQDDGTYKAESTVVTKGDDVFKKPNMFSKELKNISSVIGLSDNAPAADKTAKISYEQLIKDSNAYARQRNSGITCSQRSNGAVMPDTWLAPSDKDPNVAFINSPSENQSGIMRRNIKTGQDVMRFYEGRSENRKEISYDDLAPNLKKMADFTSDKLGISLSAEKTASAPGPEPAQAAPAKTSVPSKSAGLDEQASKANADAQQSNELSEEDLNMLSMV